MREWKIFVCFTDAGTSKLNSCCTSQRLRYSTRLNNTRQTKLQYNQHVMATIKHTNVGERMRQLGS